MALRFTVLLRDFEAFALRHESCLSFFYLLTVLRAYICRITETKYSYSRSNNGGCSEIRPLNLGINSKIVGAMD